MRHDQLLLVTSIVPFSCEMFTIYCMYMNEMSQCILKIAENEKGQACSNRTNTEVVLGNGLKSQSGPDPGLVKKSVPLPPCRVPGQGVKQAKGNPVIGPLVG